jgi:hypothetical protein
MSEERSSLDYSCSSEQINRYPSQQTVSTALFAGFDSDGRFLILIDEHDHPREALSTVGLSEADIGRKIVVASILESEHRPIIIGRLQDRREPIQAPKCRIDGEDVVLRGKRQIELRCGEASIVLTQAGKVLIKGNFVLSRSRGANKIKGAFVDIN